MERTHLSFNAGPIEVQPRVLEMGTSPQRKPPGFWYEVDGDWRRWCESEQFLDPSAMTLHRVTLVDERILYVRSSDELIAFGAEYGASRWVGSASATMYSDAVSWFRVAMDYDGIEIAPYLWERRLDGEVGWYYGWDCASGVIWRPQGVVVEPIKSEVLV